MTNENRDLWEKIEVPKFLEPYLCAVRYHTNHEYSNKTRFEIENYENVKKELEREDINGEWIKSLLPNDSDVELVLGNTCVVRFFVFTKNEIFLLHIGTISGCDMIDGKMQAWQEEEWDILIIPRTGDMSEKTTVQDKIEEYKSKRPK